MKTQGNANSFASRLRRLMDQRRLTQDAVASMMGLATSSVSRWLGGSIPRKDVAQKLADELKVNVEWLVEGVGPKDASEGYNSMLAEFSKLAQEYAISEPEALLDRLTGAVTPLLDTVLKPSSTLPDGIRRVPVLGWAHAGAAAAYEEIPEDWQNFVLTDCRDPRAFGVTLEGESMADSFHEGDELVVMPSEIAHSGSLAVCKFKDSSFVFRRIEILGDQICLVPENKRYSSTHHHRSDFEWIFPIWESRRQLWKK